MLPSEGIVVRNMMVVAVDDDTWLLRLARNSRHGDWLRPHDFGLGVLTPGIRIILTCLLLAGSEPELHGDKE